MAQIIADTYPILRGQCLRWQETRGSLSSTDLRRNSNREFAKNNNRMQDKA
jgi:hypothetical protein